MKYKVKDFLKKDGMVIDFKFDNNHNVLYEWTKIRSPFKTFKNYFIISICKFLPLKMKLFFFKIFS